ncbi:type IV secretory system conjugative DNA transfer family protein [Streptomyces sp. NBC_00893]|uniref:type IV secretory system conjugative DNA transfer family protein n=1 Tax=Streptomyces sp. NBC_00893 TaxID=2975862 RepID=UPI002257B0D4|nr:type IV secretory system conjugative DNA transfer family protein [Streptomyces sp. NBC_00893]MCX4846467.1 type IV secretory system conjugative DNA transfer family protein [Streptomyces sp. NBC_00893]
MAGRAEQRTGGNGSGSNGGGIPDGMLIALLAFLLGLTLLAWTATGLAGLFAHGAWPEGVTLAETPLSLRRLVTAPHDLPAAWPNTPAGELSGYGLFWGLFIGELMVLLVLTVFVLGVVARWRAVRARQRAGRYGGGEADEYEDEYEPVRSRRRQEPRRRARRNDTTVPLFQEDDTTVPLEHIPAETAPLPRTAPAPAVASTPGRRAEPTTTATGAEAATGPHAAPDRGPDPGPAPDPGAPVLPPLPSPRTPVVYGPAATRRPTAVQAIREAGGPALVVTSDPTVWAETKDARAKLGPVLVYDPGHLCDTPARLHWSPTAGCEKPDTAAARSAALLAPVRPQARIDAATADTAETLLRCWLHAAAIDGRPFRQVHRWALGGSAHEPVRLLRTHPKAASGLAGLLESALTAHPERREMAQELTVRAFGALSSVHIREACTPNRADSLALESFAGEGGTLYVVGEPIEDPRSGPGAMPLLTALAAHVVEHGRRLAARSADGRLDPPMTLVLDDIAAVAPLPRLPELLANGRDTGLPTLALLRSREQARARWPQGV